ncbi:MAG TPA: flagellar biosynthetic protein FliO [Bryobacteraceae bacterium]|nr:flagellar biosynthetic protein FliO [Bryobacteraceae bacterium]
MDTTLLLLAAASLVALPLAARLLVAVQQGWRPGARLRRGTLESGCRLRVIARAQLSPQHSLHLVETAGGTLLISCSPKGTKVLDRHTQREGSAMTTATRAAMTASR